MNGYMFDTNVLNEILDGKVDPSQFTGKNCFVTHIQHDEIQATSNPTRRSLLESLFSLLPQEELPTESLVLDVSRFDKAKLSDGVLHAQLQSRLNKLNKGKRNNLQDVLIAETALSNDLTLVTHDRDLFRVTTEFGGAVCNLQHLLRI